MSTKTKETESSETNTQNQSSHQGHRLGDDPSLGFQLVAIGLVAYILYSAKFVTFTWLYPLSIAFIIIGFFALILKVLTNIKIR